MNDQEILDRAERAARSVVVPDGRFEELLRRRDRKRRNQRLTAGAVGIAVFVVLVWAVTSLAFDRTQTPGVPGGTETGPTETGPPTPTPAVTHPEVDYLLDLETGEVTPLPKSIVGTEDLTGEFAVSPDGSTLAYVAPGDNGTRQIFVANLDGTGAAQVTSARGTTNTMPAWSPDGSRIAYIDDNVGLVFVVELATGVSTQVTFYGRESAPAFSPDGSSIVYSTGRENDAPGDQDDVHQVRIVPIAGGESMRLVGGHGVDAYSGTLSPDGSLLSYACGDPGDISNLCLANADGTDARTLVTGNIPNAGSWSPDGTRIAYWSWSIPSGVVWVVDLATGEVTSVTRGAYPRWLDDHTLLVETDYCNRLHDTCGG